MGNSVVSYLQIFVTTLWHLLQHLTFFYQCGSAEVCKISLQSYHPFWLMILHSIVGGTQRSLIWSLPLALELGGISDIVWKLSFIFVFSVFKFSHRSSTVLVNASDKNIGLRAWRIMCEGHWRCDDRKVCIPLRSNGFLLILLFSAHLGAILTVVIDGVSELKCGQQASDIRLHQVHPILRYLSFQLLFIICIMHAAFRYNKVLWIRPKDFTLRK